MIHSTTPTLEARETAFEEVTHRAHALGTNTIVGIDIACDTLGTSGGMMIVSVSGTAVSV